jgi:hypothetical protein
MNDWKDEVGLNRGGVGHKQQQTEEVSGGGCGGVM